MITYCDQSFHSPWHCLSAAPSLSGAALLSILEGVSLSATWVVVVVPQPSANLSYHQFSPALTFSYIIYNFADSILAVLVWYAKICVG